MRKFDISVMLAMTGLLSVSGPILADSRGSISELDGSCIGNAISRNGKYIVGTDPSYHIYGINMSSFVYRCDTGEIEWSLAYDQNDVTKGGEFTGVNNSGIIIGTTKDPDNIITFSDFDGSVSMNANVATIFINGEATRLGYGTHSVSEFNDLSDGSYGRAVSDDGKTAIGYVSACNQAYHYPTVWRQQEDGTWTAEQLPLPEGSNGGEALGISSDGKIISGNMWRYGNHRPCYWIDGECHVIERDADDWRPEWGGMSSDGRFISYTCSYHFYIYDCKEGTFRELPKEDDTYVIESLYASVADNGDLVAAYTENGSKKPFYYSYADDRLYDFKKYCELNAPDAQPSFTIGNSVPRDITADGMTVMGNYGNSKCYVLVTADTNAVIADAPEKPELISTALNEVTATWPEYTKTYEGLTLSGYNIYRNGELAASARAGDERTYTFRDVPAGYPVFTMSAVFTRSDNSEIESQLSPEVSVAVARNYDLPLYDQFEGSYYGNYWMENIIQGDKIDQRWGCLQYLGIESSFALSNGNANHAQHSSALESRPLDATECGNVSINFISQFDFVNSREWDLTKDGFGIEVSTDFGKTWQEVVYYPLSEQSFGWRMYDIDLSEYVAGKVFRVRIHNHGDGTALYRNQFDNLKITATPEREAPTALAGHTGANGDLTLMWHSTLDTYQLNYLYDYPYLMGLGDEGREFITANSFEPEDLAPYAGKYLTSVSALINHNDGIEKVTKANALVYVDNKLVAEQEIKDIVPNRENCVILDEPILIDATEEIKVGIKIYDYDPADMPIIYQNALRYKYRKSDLYSQDGGRTWKSLADFYADSDLPEDGYAIWYISANFTDAPVGADAPVLEDPDIFCYNIYKNGELLNSLIIDPAAVHYLDTTPDMNAAYTVKAYYKNGDVSKVSESYVPALSGVKAVNSESEGFNYSRHDETISAEGTISVYTPAGVKVTCGNSRVRLSDLPEGIYIIIIDNNGTRSSHKIWLDKE